MERNIVDVLYLDYALYKIVEIYNKSLYKRLRNKQDNIPNINKSDMRFYKNITNLIKSSLEVEYDDEIIKKIMYVKILQILDSSQKSEGEALAKVKEYLKIVENKMENFDIFRGETVEELLDWVDEIYKSFSLPYLYEECIKLI
ncbi:uncharacterized protein VNE69_06172 [Vairimorpha necatrix]|uniref:Uncharacterized protein n=1 Tax=Vairimorpha necatrix TaxID=6039 RepID=A0AAX4JDB7_9MICR